MKETGQNLHLLRKSRLLKKRQTISYLGPFFFRPTSIPPPTLLLLGAILVYENPPQHMRGHRHRNDSHPQLFLSKSFAVYERVRGRSTTGHCSSPLPPGLNIGYMAKSLWAPRAVPTECGTTELFRRARAEPNIKIGGGGWMTSIRYTSDAHVCSRQVVQHFVDVPHGGIILGGG